MSDRRGKRIADEWNSFREVVLAGDASEKEVVDMRRAWYAGAVALFALFTRTVDKDGAPPTEKEVGAVAGWAQELSDFADEVMRGRA